MRRVLDMVLASSILLLVGWFLLRDPSPPARDAPPAGSSSVTTAPDDASSVWAALARSEAKDHTVRAATPDERLSVEVEAGTRWARPPRQGEIPPVIEGGATFRVYGSLTLAGVRLESARAGEPFAVDLLPAGLRIKSGRVRVRDRVLGPGAWIPLPAPSPTVAPGSSAPGGCFVDARTGEPLAGVEVLVTWTHTDEGDPPLPEVPRERARTDERGEFPLRSPRPEDPRLRAHLQARRSGYLPEIRVLEGPADTQGLFPYVTLRLREGESRRFRLIDLEENPLPLAAVAVDRPRFDRFLGEDIWDERGTWRAGRAEIHYSDEDGFLTLPSDARSIWLRHPHFLLVKSARGLPTRVWSAIRRRLDLEPESPLRDQEEPIFSRPGEERRVLLVDSAGNPLAHTLIEIERPALPRVRSYTDAEGTLSFSLPPADSEGSGGGLVLRSLSPFLWKTEARLLSPPADGEFLEIPGFPAPRVRLDLRAGEGSGSPLTADDLQIESDLTLVSRSGRRVELAGTLPPPKTTLRCRVRGGLPTEIRVPPYPPGTDLLDLGEVVFERGESLAVRISGVEDARLPRFRLGITDAEGGWNTQWARFPDGPSIRVHGLALDRLYRYRLEISGRPPLDGEFLLTKSLQEEGLALDPSQAPPLTEIRAHVLPAPPDELSGYRVIERFFYDDPPSWQTLASYPLPAHREFGSVRSLPSPREVEVFVLAPGGRAGEARGAIRRPGTPLDLGLVDVRPVASARFRFRSKELGMPVFPPDGLDLEAAEDDYHDVASLARRNDGTLFIGNLMPGSYVLRWKPGDGPEGGHAFEVEDRFAEISETLTVESGARARGWLEVVDDRGRSVERVTARRIEPPPDLPTPGEPTSPLDGGAWLDVVLEVPNVFEVRAPGHLPVSLRRPAHEPMLESLVLPRGVEVRARILDSGGRAFDGDLELTWRSADEGLGARREDPPSTSVEGLQVLVPVERGLLHSRLFPPGRTRVRLADRNSEACVELDLQLARRAENSLGTLRLEETRTLRGRVFLPDGTPAIAAEVALVLPGGARRIPFAGRRAAATRYSTRVDSSGEFTIDGLPLFFDEPRILLAHLDGWTDALEEPFDPDQELHLLWLGHETRLDLFYGLDSFPPRFDHAFRLEYWPSDLHPDPLTRVPLPPIRPEPLTFRGISPGRYRVTWELAKDLPGLSFGFESETWVDPGVAARLELTVSDGFWEGFATFDGAPLDSGWIRVTDDPSDPRRTRVGRVEGGRYLTPVPSGAERLWATLIPEARGTRGVSFELGSAPPVVSLRPGRALSIEGHDLVVEVPLELREENPDLEVLLPYPVWNGEEFEWTLRAAPPRSDGVYRLELIPEAIYPVRVVSPHRWRSLRQIRVSGTTRYVFQR